MNHEVGLKLKQMMEIADELFVGTDIMVRWIGVSIEHQDVFKAIPKEEADLMKQSLVEAGFDSGEKVLKHDGVEQQFTYKGNGTQTIYIKSEVNEAEQIERLEKEREALQQRIDKLQVKKTVKDPDSERSAV